MDDAARRRPDFIIVTRGRRSRPHSGSDAFFARHSGFATSRASSRVLPAAWVGRSVARRPIALTVAASAPMPSPSLLAALFWPRPIFAVGSSQAPTTGSAVSTAAASFAAGSTPAPPLAAIGECSILMGGPEPGARSTWGSSIRRSDVCVGPACAGPCDQPSATRRGGLRVLFA